MTLFRRQILNYLHCSFIDTLSTEAIIPPHLNHVATLPCDILMLKNYSKNPLKKNFGIANKHLVQICCIFESELNINIVDGLPNTNCLSNALHWNALHWTEYKITCTWFPGSGVRQQPLIMLIAPKRLKVQTSNLAGMFPGIVPT